MSKVTEIRSSYDKGRAFVIEEGKKVTIAVIDSSPLIEGFLLDYKRNKKVSEISEGIEIVE